MTKQNLIKVTTSLTSRGDIGLYRVTRDAVLNETKTASTLVIVSELADPSRKSKSGLWQPVKYT